MTFLCAFFHSLLLAATPHLWTIFIGC